MYEPALDACTTDLVRTHQQVNLETVCAATQFAINSNLNAFEDVGVGLAAATAFETPRIAQMVAEYVSNMAAFGNNFSTL